MSDAASSLAARPAAPLVAAAAASGHPAALGAEHRALLAALPLIVYRVEPHAPYAPLYVSPGVSALGYTLDEWLATPDMWLRVLHPADRARVVAETEAALAAGTAVDYEYRVLAKDGAVRWMHDRGDFVRDAAGTPVVWQGIMLDVTDRHEAERALRASEARVRAALEGGRVGFAVLAAVRDAGRSVVDFEVVAINNHGAALVGMPTEGLVGQRYGDLLPLSREAGHVAAFAQVLATGEADELEVRVTDPRFAAEWLRLQVVPIDEEARGGAPDTVALMVRDISREQRAAHEMRLLVDVTHALAAAADLPAAARAALAAMCAATGWEYGEAWLVAADPAGDPAADEPRLVHGPVWHDAADRRLADYAAASDGFAFRRRKGLPGAAWEERVPIVLPRLDAPDVDFPRRAHARAAGLRSGVAVPVLADDAVIAVLVFHTRDARRAERAPVALLAAVAAQVGTVMRRKLAEAALAEREARFRGVLENLRAPAVQLDVAGRVTFANEALLTMTGWTAAETLGADWFDRFVPDAALVRAAFVGMIARRELAPHYENEILARDGTRRRIAWDNVLLHDADGAVIGTASVGRDVTERHALEARLAALSEHDELTGLLNRRGFRRLADHALRSAVRSRRRDAVLYLDLDQFKPINDTHGHAAGDAALRAVGEVIRTTLRDADFAARVGGDEFAIYAVDLREGNGHILAARLQANLAAHNAVQVAAGRPFAVRLSIGVAELEPGDDLDALLARGDAALYASKLARRI